MANDKTKTAALNLADLAEELMALIDEEMEHGHYQTPEFVPPEYEDEEDYYEEHDRIVDKVVDCRTKLGIAIDLVRNSEKAA